MTSDQKWDPRVFDNEVDPSGSLFISANPPNLHLLLHDDYNILGDCINAQTTGITGLVTSLSSPSGSTDHGTIDFHDHILITDSFTNDENFHDAVEHDSFLDNDVNFNFWLSDSEYSHNEFIARCIHTAAVSTSAVGNPIFPRANGKPTIVLHRGSNP